MEIDEYVGTEECFIRHSIPIRERLDLELDFARSINKVDSLSRSNTIPC